MLGLIRRCGKKGLANYLQEFMKDKDVDFVGLQDTIKRDYPQSFFKKIDPPDQFSWHWILDQRQNLINMDSNVISSKKT